jgi:hypothetical protein
MVDLPRLGEVRPIEGVPGGVPIPVSGGGTSPNQPTFAQGQKRPAAAGTGEQLSAGQPVPDGFTVFGRAFSGNSDTVYLGNSKANSEDPTVGSPLEPGDFFEIACTDVSAFWINSVVTGDGVFWYVEAA